MGEEYRELSSSLCNFLHSPVTLSLLGPNILLNTLFSNTLSLCSSLNDSALVSHPYKTTGKITVLYTNTHIIWILRLLSSVMLCSVDYTELILSESNMRGEGRKFRACCVCVYVCVVTFVTEFPVTGHRLKIKTPQRVGSCICFPLQVKCAQGRTHSEGLRRKCWSQSLGKSVGSAFAPSK